MKSLTYALPKAVAMVAWMAVTLTPRVPAFSQSVSTLY